MTRFNKSFPVTSRSLEIIVEASVAPLALDSSPSLVANQALVIGELVTEPERRTLPGGTELFAFGLTVRRDGHATTSVPIVWYDPPKRVNSWKLGAVIAVCGPVVRRFYRAGGVTASRTEVNVVQAQLLTAKRGMQKLLSAYVDEAARLAEPFE